MNRACDYYYYSKEVDIWVRALALQVSAVPARGEPGARPPGHGAVRKASGWQQRRAKARRYKRRKSVRFDINNLRIAHTHTHSSILRNPRVVIIPVFAER